MFDVDVYKEGGREYSGKVKTLRPQGQLRIFKTQRGDSRSSV